MSNDLQVIDAEAEGHKPANLVMANNEPVDTFFGATFLFQNFGLIVTV